MSCCGNKRKEWVKETRSSMPKESVEDTTSVPADEKPGRVFEYTGNNFLTITGVASGKPYHFKCKGDKVKIDYTDSFSMMAERDLVIVDS